MGDVDPFDGPRRLLQAQHLAQADRALARLDVKHLRLHVLVDVAAQPQALERGDLVAQPGRFFELQLRARLGHRLFELLEQLVLLAFQHHAQPANLLAVFFLGDAEVARGRALADAVQDARPKPAATARSLMSSPQVRNWKMRCSTWIAARRLLALVNGP